jgi:hypothetical protein
MKRNILFAAALALSLMAVGVYAQEKGNFSGHWDLDTSKSKLDERARVQSMTLDVTQTAADIKVESKTTRAPRPEGDTGGNGGGRGMGRGRGFGGGDSAMTYSLDGKETTIQQDGPMGQVPVTLKAKVDGGKLHLSSSRTFNGPNGEVSVSTKETWTLSDDGKTLTIEREQSSPLGTNSSTMVFTKK